MRSLPDAPSRPLRSSLAGWLAIGLACACSPGVQQTPGNPSGSLELREGSLILTTVTMLADVAEQVAGPVGLEVRSLMGPGIDPHLFRAGREEVQALLDAPVVVALGLHLEAQLLPALERTAATGTSLWLGENWLDASALISTTESGGSHDPHVWMDPSLWAHVVRGFAGELAASFPESREAEREAVLARGEQLVDELERVDAWAAETLGTIPAPKRLLVTSHDAFGYLGRRYGLEVRGLQGLSTESEAGLQRVVELVDLLVEREVPALFGESTVSTQGLRALIEGAAARGHQVQLAGQLYSDATGPAGSGADTVIGMFRHNVETITLALGGTASHWSEQDLQQSPERL